MSDDLLIACSFGELPRPSCLIVLRRLEALGSYDEKRHRWRVDTSYECPLAERRPCHYGELIAYLGELAGDLEFERLTILTDLTPCGRSVSPLLRHLRAVPCVIGESGAAKPSGGAWNIARPDIVSHVALMLGSGRLKPCAELVPELNAFSARKTDEGHSPMVLALGLAIWWSERRLRDLSPQPRPPRRFPKLKTLDELVAQAGGKAIERAQSITRS